MCVFSLFFGGGDEGHLHYLKVMKISGEMVTYLSYDQSEAVGLFTNLSSMSTKIPVNHHRNVQKFTITFKFKEVH